MQVTQPSTYCSWRGKPLDRTTSDVSSRPEAGLPAIDPIPKICFANLTFVGVLRVVLRPAKGFDLPVERPFLSHVNSHDPDSSVTSDYSSCQTDP